ncbi:serine hydrolase [bacterium]|nr:serine hydrolase [bacterium]
MSEANDRRSFFLHLGLSAATLAAGDTRGIAFAENEQKTHEKIAISGVANAAYSPFDDMMTAFLEKHGAPGAALAVSRQGQMVYARGFGLADSETGRPVLPDSLFRIASVSKPVTAIAMLRIAARNSVPLDTPVFDILPPRSWLARTSDTRLKRVSIRHLLQHRAGWDRDRSFDPIGRPVEAVRSAKKRLPAKPEDILRYALTLPLDFAPGEAFAYSNVGYLLLGRVIEHLSKTKYENFVRENVLNPAGISRMKLGRSWSGDLEPDEVRYYDVQNRKAPAVNGPKLGVTVPLVYGGENFEGYEAHGGWIASAPDLVRFASAVDSARNPLLEGATLRALTERPEGVAGFESGGKPRPAYYGCGWNVRPVGSNGKANTWHNGLIAGTSALLVRRHDGLNWAVVFNTDRSRDGQVLANLIDPLIHRAADSVREWPVAIEPVKPGNSKENRS